jgi:hypothetical protein
MRRLGASGVRRSVGDDQAMRGSSEKSRESTPTWFAAMAKAARTIMPIAMMRSSFGERSFLGVHPVVGIVD